MRRLANLRAEHDPEGLGEGREPRLQRGHAPGVLEVQRDQIEHPEEGRRDQEHDDVGGTEQPTREQAEVHHRSSRPQLHHHQAGEEDEARHAGGDDLVRRPSVERPRRHAVHQEAQPGATEDEPRQVEPAGVDRAGALQVQRTEDHRGNADGEVDEEDPAPRQARHQEATEHRPERRRHRRRKGQDAGGPHTLRRWEDPVEHGHAHRRHHPATRALDDPEDDELRHVLRQPAEDRAQREHDDGGEQHALAAEAVAQPTGGGDEDREADQIRDDDTVDGGGGDMEIAADGGQGHVDDRDVHDVHEHRRHEHGPHGDLLVQTQYCHVPILFGQGCVCVSPAPR